MDGSFSDRGYCLPSIASVELSAFDLYRRKPDVRIDIEPGVFCLIGANGLGKSTYLSSLLYGLTGGIPHRDERFSSPHEYAAEASRLGRRQDYYGGRVSEEAAVRASITVELRWPGISASVTRQLLGPGVVSALEVQSKEKEVSERLSGEKAESAYQELVVEQCGLPSFEQFIFIAHYVCAFDEDRHLLLWDSAALTNALYLAFGSSAKQAAEANDLKREVERKGSRARNSRFAARKSLDEAERLQKVLSGEDGEQYDGATLNAYKKLNDRLDEAVRRVHTKDAELRKVEVVVADRSAVITELQLEYEEVFGARAEVSSITRHHPLVRSSMRSDRCVVCAAEGVGEKIQCLLDSGVCPLCGSRLAQRANDEASLEKLKRIDQQIEKIRVKLEKVLGRRQRLQEDHVASVQAEDAARKADMAFPCQAHSLCSAVC